MGFAVHQPQTVAEATALALRFGGDARFLAGGTDLMIQIARKHACPAHLIALASIDGLAGVRADDHAITLAALTTHKYMETHPAFAGGLAALAEAARAIGGHQIRNVGTVGGNIVNASPAADLLPVLLVLDAEVDLTGADGMRRLPLSHFLRAPGVTDRLPDELLLRAVFERPPASAATAFVKFGRRRAMEIAIVCVAALLDLAEDGTCRAARIALGAVGPTALRAVAAEQSLNGRRPGAEAFQAAGKLAAVECAPIDDVRASAAYRRRLVAVLVPRALQQCLERIGR